MDSYARGRGHEDLAQQLGLSSSRSLAIPGSCNNRIIRTTLKDSYQTQEKTLYIVGLTFLRRTELSVAPTNDPFEGRWISFQNMVNPQHRYADHWTLDYTRAFLDIKLRADLFGLEDLLEQLMYQLLSLIGDLTHRGHQILIFRNPQEEYYNILDSEKFKNLQNCVNIVDALQWEAIPWQVAQGIEFHTNDAHLPQGLRHPAPGQHGHLNTFLVEYINQHALHLPILS
jgi:hypothetical protein